MAGNGDVPKWLKGADSKSARRRKACGGSNPSISASTFNPGIVFQYRDLFFVFISLWICGLHSPKSTERGGDIKAELPPR